jgi:hypothetical protein
MTVVASLPVLRRFLVLAALMFWQGGFVFYAGVVVPIGTEVLGSPSEQARITRRVALSLNASGAIALVFFLWDCAASRVGRGVYWTRWVTWLVMFVALVALVAIYPRLDNLFLPDEVKVLSRPTFRFWHRTYLWTSSVQWAAAVLFAVLTIVAWRRADCAVAVSKQGM